MKKLACLALAGSLALGATLVAGCSSGSSSDTATKTTTLVKSSPDLPDFYAVPTPLPLGQPGELIKSEKVEIAGLNGTMWRVMYHSQAIDGTDIAVTGLVASPEGGPTFVPATADGATPAPVPVNHPVVTWAHGTTGIADSCAPSLEPGGSEIVMLANALLDQGFVVTASDFEGLATPGRHPYIAGESEGRGTLDIVKTAVAMPEVKAQSDYIIWGHSQGGHAAMFAGHIADTWAPELSLKGVVAGAPPSQLLLINAALQTSPYKYYIAMAAAGLNAAFGDEKAPLDKVLTPEGLTWLENVDKGCTDLLSRESKGVDFSTLQKADPATVPEWNALLSANDPGTFTAPIAAPLLIIHGGNDEQIPVVASQMMFTSLCTIGQVETRWVLPGQSHAGVIAPSAPSMITWMHDRFNGDPMPDAVAPEGAQVQNCPN